MDLVHLWLIRGGADKKHGFLLVGHFPDNKLLKRDHRRLVVLGGRERGKVFIAASSRYSSLKSHVQENVK